MPATEADKPSGPFSGLLVVDLMRILNGSFGTDDTRTYGPFVKGQLLYFSSVNRGQQIVAGMFMFSGVPAALYGREKTGKRAYIDVVMLDGTFEFLEQGLMDFSATGEAPQRIGNRHPYMTPFDTFEAPCTQFMIACGNNRLIVQLCRAIGRQELSQDRWFATDPDRTRNNVALNAEVETALKKEPAAHRLKVIQEADGVRMPGNPVEINGCDDPPVRTGPPALGQHGAALCREFVTSAHAAAE